MFFHPKWWLSIGKSPLFHANLGWWNILPFGQIQPIQAHPAAVRPIGRYSRFEGSLYPHCSKDWKWEDRSLWIYDFDGIDGIGGRSRVAVICFGSFVFFFGSLNCFGLFWSVFFGNLNVEMVNYGACMYIYTVLFEIIPIWKLLGVCVYIDI